MRIIPAHTTAANHARMVFFFAFGGALGTLLRAGFNQWLPHELWPWNTFAVNLLGSFLIGLVLEAGIKLHAHVRAFHAVGFCGGLTTFSAFAVETARLWQHGHAGMAAGYIAASVFGCFFAVYAGFRCTGLWPRRLTEEKP
jgi:CrcB protein